MARSAKYTGIEYRVIMNEVQVRFVKSFESRDEVRLLKKERFRVFEKGKFELIRLGGMTIGRAAYDRGRKWSEHVGREFGARRCGVEHVGLVLSGTATAALELRGDSSLPDRNHH